MTDGDRETETETETDGDRETETETETEGDIETATETETNRDSETEPETDGDRETVGSLPRRVGGREAVTPRPCRRQSSGFGSGVTSGTDTRLCWEGWSRLQQRHIQSQRQPETERQSQRQTETERQRGPYRDDPAAVVVATRPEVLPHHFPEAPFPHLSTEDV